MILGYGHDDRVCAYPSMLAQINVANVERTSITLIVDKEEIGSVGATGMTSRFFKNTVAEIMTLAGEDSPLTLRRALARSRMLLRRVCRLRPGLCRQVRNEERRLYGSWPCFNKYTGSRGKGGSNDADAEYVALVRDIMDEAGVDFQTCELGRVNAGGGGTIAYIMAKYGMNVIDFGVAVLSMHALWEVANKADIYEAYRGYKAFLERAISTPPAHPAVEYGLIWSFNSPDRTYSTATSFFGRRAVHAAGDYFARQADARGPRCF